MKDRSNPRRFHIHFVHCFALCFALLLCLCGCRQKNGSSAQTNPAQSSTSVTPDSLVLISETEEKERDALQKSVQALFEKAEFAKLESMAGEFRTNKTRFRNGTWKLRMFYAAFGSQPGGASDSAWKSQITRGEEWSKTFPKSITARIALAEIYRGYAWEARGGDWASKVTEQAWRLMGERLQKSLQYLQDAAKLGITCPGWYSEAQRVGLGAQLERPAYEKLFERGVKAAPDYDAIYVYKAYYLLPRWYGSEGEWESFAMQTMKRDEIPGAKEIFARAAMYLRDLGVFYQEFSGSDTSWEALKQSFREVEKNYPDSLEVKSIFCLMCCKQCDYKEAREQMKLLDHKVDLSVWDSETNFLAAGSWLNNKDSELEQCRQDWKRQHQK